MTATSSSTKIIGIYGLIILMLASLILLLKSPLYNQNEILNLGITADLILTVPVIYFLLIRKTKIPNITAVPVMIIGLVLGTIFIPIENQHYLELFKTFILPVVELAVLGFIIYKVTTAIKTYKKHQSGSKADFYTLLKQTCNELIPEKVANILATEIALIYYGFLKWRSPKLSTRQFTYHKSGSGIALLIMIMFLVVVETFVFHLLLMQWSVLAAWILSGLSIYTGLQVFGILKSLAHRPIEITQQALILRYGTTNECLIPLEKITAIEKNSNVNMDKAGVKHLSILGNLEPHTICITTNEEMTLSGLYGMSKQFTKLVINVDQPDQFLETYHEVLGDKC